MSGSVQILLGLLFGVLACWSLGDWYVARILFIPDQTWLALAPLAAVALAWRDRRAPWAPLVWSRWVPSTGLILLYALLPAEMPLTLKALPAAGVFLFLPGPWRSGFWPKAPLVGLVLLGLPALFMLQFYFGFPLQIVSAALAVPILNGAGIPVVREGALLILEGQGVGVDAACNGIRMGWTALFLALFLCGLHRLGYGRTTLAVAGSLILVVLLNALRVAVLFGLDWFGLERPVLHTGVGVMLFVILAAAVVLGIGRLARRRP